MHNSLGSPGMASKHYFAFLSRLLILASERAWRSVIGLEGELFLRVRG